LQNQAACDEEDVNDQGEYKTMAEAVEGLRGRRMDSKDCSSMPMAPMPIGRLEHCWRTLKTSMAGLMTLQHNDDLRRLIDW